MLTNLPYARRDPAEPLPNRTVTAGITHVLLASASSKLFAPGGSGGNSKTYTPFKSVADVRALFDHGCQVGISVGGWGDTEGFSAAAADQDSRKVFSDKLAAMVREHGFDFVGT